MKRIAALVSILALAATTACRTRSYQRIPMPNQEIEISDLSRARIYLMRPKQVYGESASVHVWEAHTGDVHVGEIGAGAYLCWERLPGRSLLHAENRQPDRATEHIVEGVMSLEAEAGHAYYVKLHMASGQQTFKPTMELLSMYEGRKMLDRLKPAKL